jgi:hypothetical protein
MSTNRTNDNDELKEEKSDHEFAKAFIYDATSKDENSFAHIKEEIEKNKYYGDIILPKISEQNNVIVKSIEEQLVVNNNEFTRYPSDYIHAQMCKDVESNTNIKEDDPNQPANFNEEFVVHKIFEKYTGNRVLVYFAVLYLNETRKQFVLATKGIEASIFKSREFSSHDALSNSLKGLLCNQTIPELYAVNFIYS